VREAEIAVTNAQQKLSAVGAFGKTSALNQFELRAPSTAPSSKSTSRSANR
jgi:hypothetical protein